MYIQQTTHSYGPLSMPMFVKASEDGRTVTVRWGVAGDVHLALSPDEAERLRDGLTAALAEVGDRRAEYVARTKADMDFAATTETRAGAVR